MDENGDGVLDRDEIEHCIRNLGFPFEEVIHILKISTVFYMIEV